MENEEPSKESVSFEDRQFGIFKLDRLVNQFETDTTWNSRPVRLSLDVEDDLDPKTALKIARLLWNSQTEWNQKIYDYAALKMLPIKNDFWLENGEKKITEIEFKDRMTLESVSVSPYGRIEFWFDDGDLFWGHSIRVAGSLSDGLSDASFEG